MACYTKKQGANPNPKTTLSLFNSYNNIVLPEVTFNTVHNQTAFLV
jgi:hypothetical protein